jgi:ribosomal protein L11 methyltransferase
MTGLGRALWRVDVLAPANLAEAIEAALEEGLADTLLATSRMQRGDQWAVQAIVSAAPESAQVRGLLAASGRLRFEIAALPDKNWVEESLRRLPPVRAGRFRILGSHHERPRTGAHELLIDAGPAFGTGQHATTRGCLLALERMARRRPRAVLDLGCGTGVLAMAAAMLWRGSRPCILASDLDRASVVEARRNLARNGLGGAAQVVAADGLDHASLRRGGPYDVILANILAPPLIRLAPRLTRRLAPGGVIVLSGLLEGQEPAVRNAYRATGLILLGRIRLPGWPTLLLRRT